jgi:putative flippase GtrA
MKEYKIAYKRIAKFLLVGTMNAAISFGILNISFYYLHQSKIVSSLIGTSCALFFSFVMNRNYVFGAKSESAKKQILPFVLVTISGSLLMLNLVYTASIYVLDARGLWLTQTINNLTGLGLSQNFVDINVSTAIGAMFAMVWNYNGYKLFVFKNKSILEDDEASTT